MPKFELNERAEFIKCCEQCSKLFGMPAKRIAGRRLDEFVALESGSHLLMALLDAYRGKPVKGVRLIINTAADTKMHVGLSLKAEIDPHTQRITRLLGEFDCSKCLEHKQPDLCHPAQSTSSRSWHS
jgi:hypothetical protein